MKITIITLVIIYLISCTSKNTDPPKGTNPPVSKCDTASGSTVTHVLPAWISNSTYSEISNPFKRKYKFTSDSTALYTWLVNNNPVIYDSISLKMRQQAMGSFSFYKNDTLFNCGFYVACAGSNVTGPLFDTLFIVTSNPVREVLTLKKFN